MGAPLAIVDLVKEPRGAGGSHLPREEVPGDLA